MTPAPEPSEILDSGDRSLYAVTTHGPDPQGKLPLTAEILLERPSSDAFGVTEDAGMGWPPQMLVGPEAVDRIIAKLESPKGQRTKRVRRDTEEDFVIRGIPQCLAPAATPGLAAAWPRRLNTPLPESSKSTCQNATTASPCPRC